MNATRAADAPPVVRRRARGAFYVAMALMMIAIALVGFWPRYYGRLLGGTGLDARSSHLLIHVHSTLFFGWLFMLLGQAMLVRAGRTAIHRQIGPLLAAYGYGCAAIGVWAGLVLAARRVQMGQTLDQAASFVFVTMTDMLTFAGFLTAAVLWRRRPEPHKRLMVLATWSLAIVGFSRMISRIPGFADERWWLGSLVFPLPALIGILYDWRTRGRVHPVWWIGLAAFIVWANRGLYGRSEAWLPIGRAIVRQFH